jgi:hypothetical protein
MATVVRPGDDFDWNGPGFKTYISYDYRRNVVFGTLAYLFVSAVLLAICI